MWAALAILAFAVGLALPFALDLYIFTVSLAAAVWVYYSALAGLIIWRLAAGEPGIAARVVLVLVLGCCLPIVLWMVLILGFAY